ncbi:MAG: hypothetical protein GF368_02190 [Candidatus Aenigmarchaeota archaeon]|nr:hypothetical protein [Candidatus Aenigmarchaeota archaeon]
MNAHADVIDSTLGSYGIRGRVLKGVLTPNVSRYCVGLPPDETPYLPDFEGLSKSIAEALGVSSRQIIQNRKKVGAEIEIPRYELFPETEPTEQPDFDF